MQLEISVLNKVLKNIEYPKSAGLVNQDKVYTRNIIGVHNDWEGNQGDSNEYYITYTHPELDGILVKFTYETDSYGGNDRITSIQFGRAVKKEISVFEEVK